MDDTRTRIIRAAMAAVRRYGLEGVRIQNVSEFAGITPGAIYRHFESKEQLLTECFTFVDKQAAEIFEHLKWDPLVMLTDRAPGRDRFLSPVPGQRDFSPIW